MPKPKRKTDDEIEKIVRAAVADAQSYMDDHVKPDRLKAMRYADGECDVATDEGRSKVVATPVRDIIRAAKPGVLRALIQSGSPCEFVPSQEEDVEVARHRTEKVRQVFEASNGFVALHDAIDDAMKQKIGFLKIFWDESEEVEIDEYTGLHPLVAQQIAREEGVEVLEADVSEDGQGIDMRVSKTLVKGRVRIDPLEPENCFWDASATCVEDARCIGHVEEMALGDLVEMGFEWEDIEDLAPAEDDEEDELRRGRDSDTELDPASRVVEVVEAYMRVDIEGTGIPQLHRFTLAGAGMTLLDHEPADEVPFADFVVDRVPHSLLGRSLAELLVHDQDAATVLWRGLIDGTIQSTVPRWLLNPEKVDMRSVANAHKHGAIVMADDIGAIREISLGSNVVPQAQAALAMMDEQVAKKTGVAGLSMGLDAEALQGQSATAASIAEKAALAQMELMARIAAEGGMKRLCRLVDMLIRQHPDDHGMLQTDGGFVPLDPRSWSEADVMVKVGLGRSDQQQRLVALNQATTLQMSIFQTLGPGNPLVGLAEIRAGLAALLHEQGIHDVSKFFRALSPQQEAMLMEQMKQASQGQEQQNPVAEAEMIRAQQKDRDGLLKHQREMQALAMEDDRKRDEMAQERTLDAAKLLGEYGLQVNEQQLRAEQAAPRYPGQ